MKKRLSPNTLKFISTLTVGLIVLVFVTTISNVVMRRTLVAASENYMQTCSQMLDGYSKAIQWYLENYNTSLNSMGDERILSESSAEEIQRWLKKEKPNVHKDVLQIYFVDSDNTVYFDNGYVIKGSTRKYSNGSRDNHVSDITTANYRPTPFFVIEHPIFTKYGNLRGHLCAMIEVTTMNRITDLIKIGSTERVYLQDRNGKFIVHPDEKYLGKTFIPTNNKYAIYTSEAVSNSDSGIIETEDENGEVVNLFYTKIQNCGWTLALSFKKSHLENVFKRQNTTRFIVLGISAIALLLLILLENTIIDSFYKKQIITTEYDSLTNLWTRQRFEAEADKLLRHNSKNKFMLVEADIRGFKFLNQNYGEETADQIIQLYSKHLNDITKQFHGLIGRGFADHFYLLYKSNSVRRSMNVFKSSLENLNQRIKDNEIQFLPKFGISFYLPNEKNRQSTIKDLIGQASFAKSTIKDNMLIQYAIFNDKLLKQINHEHFIETSMEAALANEEFFIMYQPKISLETDKIVGAEALVRWYHKKEGLLTPDKFIPLFEKNGFITKLDFYVYDKVFNFIDRQIKDGNNIVPISVNMSRNHSKPEKFMYEFLKAFNKYNIPPEMVQVEILERSFMDSDTLQQTTQMLHTEGFTVAMDDFGSGESSLNMLTKISVDVLKFDREFLITSTRENGSLDEKAAKFIEILINLSKHLEKQTIFEGVETQVQRDFLRSIKCDQAQGYFYSKPLAEQDFIQFIKLHS